MSDKWKKKNMNNFWNDWYYRDDVDKWVHDDFDFQWMINQNPDNVDDDFKNYFIHHSKIVDIKKTGWEKIKSLPIREEEKNLQDWMLIGIICDIENIDKIEMIFYESNFDIYRETYLVFKIEGDKYHFIESFYENA